MNNEPIRPASLPEPIQSDRWIYRATVGILGAVALLSVGAAAVLPIFGFQSPNEALSLGTAAVVALASLLGKNNP